VSTDVLILGPFVFTDFSVPERLPFGGRQQMHIHRMPGGSRVIDCMGPDDIDRIWNGTLWGDTALSDALALDAMRQAGEPLAYSNGVEARTAVILEFLPLVRKVTCVEYSIAIVMADGGSDGASGFGLSAIDSLIGADLSAAIGLL
jgi:hypothetical protein